MRLPREAVTIAMAFGGVAIEKSDTTTTAPMGRRRNTKTVDDPRREVFVAEPSSDGTCVGTNGTNNEEKSPALSSSNPQANTTTDNTNPATTAATALKQQLRLLVAIRCLRSAHLAQPLLVPYYSQSLGLTPSSVLWLGSVYSALVTLSELPSGILSDRLGRKATLCLAFGGFATCLVLTAVAASLQSQWLWPCLLLAQWFRAIGSALYSGTDMAFLYEILRKHNASSNSRLLTIESRNVFYTTATESCIAAFGGWLATRISLSRVVGISAIPFLVGAMLTLFLDGDLGTATTKTAKKKEESATTSTTTEINSSSQKIPSFSQQQSSDGINDKHNNSRKSFTRRASFITLPSTTPIVHTIRTSLKSLSDYVPQRLWTLFGVGVVLNCGTYLAATALNPILWETVGVPLKEFGSLHAGCGAIAAAGALLAPFLRKRFFGNSHQTEGLLLFLLGTGALGYALMGIAAATSSASATATIFAVASSLSLSLVRGMAWPVLGSAINASIQNNGSRATTLSLFSGSVKIGMVVSGMVLGALFRGDAGLLQGSLLCCAALLATFLWLAGARLRIKAD